MKKILWISIFIFFTNFSFSQNTSSLTYDVVGQDGSDRGFAISVMDDGIILVSGSLCHNYSSSCTGVIKTDFEGNEQWTVSLDDYPNRLRALARTDVLKKGDHYIVAMDYHASDNLDKYQMGLIEFDSIGHIYWQKNYEKDKSAYCYSLKELDDGYLLYGAKRNNYGGYNRYFVKTDFEGNMEWDHVVPLYPPNENTWSNKPGGLEILENGYYLQVFGTRFLNNIDEGKVLQVLDENFEPEMTKEFLSIFPYEFVDYGGSINQAWSIAGGYAMASNTDTITPSNDPIIGVGADMIVGLDTLGEVQWTSTFPSGGVTPVTNFKRTQNGDLIGCGRTNNFHYPDENGEDQREDAAWMFRISNTGELLWRREYVVPEIVALGNAHELMDLAELPDGRIAAVGQLWEKFPNGGNDGNVWMLIVDENGCVDPGCDERQIWVAAEEPGGGGVQVLRQVYFKVSPNPASSRITIDFYQTLTEDAHIALYSPFGQLLDKEKVAKGVKKYELGLETLSEGMCVVVLERGGQVLQREQVMVIK